MHVNVEGRDEGETMCVRKGSRVCTLLCMCACVCVYNSNAHRQINNSECKLNLSLHRNKVSGSFTLTAQTLYLYGCITHDITLSLSCSTVTVVRLPSLNTDQQVRTQHL